ncbi:MAG: type II toxin-antitoxin system RelE/ParE family toxin [Methanosarcinales archaeon]
MRLEITDEFKRDIKKIKDNTMQSRIKKGIQKIKDNPMIGKPLKYGLKGKRSLKIPPFRIIYIYNAQEDTVILQKFEHRDKVYN